MKIIGNGPSLNECKLDLLFKEKSSFVSFNRAYIIYEKYDFYPNYYFCIDKAVLLNCLEDIKKLLNSRIQKFILLKCNETIELQKLSDKVDLIEKTNSNHFYFGDVCVFSIYYLSKLGVKRFEVYGCDCSYIEDYEKLNVDVEYNDNDPARRIVLKPRKGSKDPNHFIDNYFDETTEYSVPRASNHLKCWKNLRKLKLNIKFKTSSKAKIFFKE